ADMLRFNDPNGRLALIAIDASGVDCTNLDSVKNTIRIQSLPWYAEIYQCPLCMLHFEVPGGFLQKGKASEVLLVYSSAGVPTPLVFAIEDRHVGKVDTIDINPIVTSNPKSVFPQYFDASDIATWQRAVVYTDGQCYRQPTGSVFDGEVDISPERPQTSLVSSSARVYATYAANTTRHGFNVFREVVWDKSVGYRVEALVMPENINYIRPARLDIYYSGNPSTTHPICASFYGVQVVNPVIVWSNWRGVWNGRTWDLGGTVYSERQWYLMSVSVDNSAVEWAVYHYNSSGRPLKLLGKTSRPPAVYPTRFWIVIGNAIVDNPGSETTSWTEAAYYAYVRVRPWVYPEPSVALAPLGGFVVAEPFRRDVVARKSSSIAIDLTSRLDISAALVKNLIIDASMRASAEIIKSSTSVGVLEVRYSYLINVSHTEPRAALGAVFTLYYVTGNTPRNLTLPSILVQYGDYWAVYNVTFTIPKWASFAVLVSIPGSVTARLAVSSGEPRVYYLQRGEEYYVANYGDGVAVLYAPWGAIKSFDDGRRPHDQAFAGYFGALYNVTNGREKWHVIVIPPGGLVKIVTNHDIRNWAPSWVRLRQIQPPCSITDIKRVYFPGNVSTSYYIVLLPGVIRGQVHMLRENGQWAQLQSYHESNDNFMWVRFESARGNLSHTGRLIVLCGSGGGGNINSVIGSGFWGVGNNYADLGTRASLAQFPDGFAVYIRTSGGTVGLSNSTTIPSFWSCTTAQTHMAIYSVGWAYYWHFDGFCFDRHIWELSGGGVFMYSLALSRSTALFRMIDRAGVETWRRSYPNAPVGFPRPFVSYRYVVVPGHQFTWYLVPFTWPEPYVR
ncbi:MAG: hypothetical protein QXR64_07370, partial [Pyrobaculum sp.]